jgi:baculoviral IAP repeat-containing protein 7/8
MLKMGLRNTYRPFAGHDIPDNNSGERQKMSETQKSPTKQPTADLSIEANRLRTFDNWDVSFIDKHTLALLGFYYYGPSDMVKCFFCAVEIGMWEDGDDVLTDHMRWSPSCNLIRRNPTNNVPIDEELLNQVLPPAPTPDVFGSRRMNTVSEGAIEAISEDDVHMYQHQLYDQGGLDAVLRGSLSLSPHRPTLSKPEHPEFAVEAKRLESYTDWPKTMRQKPQQLSDAGFFYTGKGDKVCCFSCGGGLKDWEENDEPWEQHGMWYGKCEYLKLVKGQDFIDKMSSKKEELMSNAASSQSSTGGCTSSQSPVGSQSSESSSSSHEKLNELSEKSDEEEEKKESKLCKICYSNEYNTIFLPCGHVIACAKCASSVDKCPACRQPFENVMRVYFS